MFGRNTFVFLNDDLVVLGHDVELGDFTFQAICHELEFDLAFFGDVKFIEHEKFTQDLVRRIAQRLQQNRHRHFAAAVNAEVQIVLGIKLEVEPRATVRNHAC